MREIDAWWNSISSGSRSWCARAISWNRRAFSTAPIRAPRRSHKPCHVQRGMRLAALRAAQLPPVLPRPKIAEDALGFPCFSAEQAAGKWAEKAGHEVAGHPAVVAEKPPVPGTAGCFGG